MYLNQKIAVVIPTYNEERFIATVIDTIPDFVDKIYAIDDSSDDDTNRIMVSKAEHNNKVVVIRHTARRGVGAAIVSGHIKAMQDNMDISAVMAGDGQMDPSLLSSIIEPVAKSKADYAKGNRLSDYNNRNEMPAFRLFGNFLLTALTRLASGYFHISDPQNGYSAISINTLKKLNLDKIEPGFAFENDLLVKLNVINARIIDVNHPALYRGQHSKIRYPQFIIRTSWILLKDFMCRIWVKYVKNIFQ